MANRRRSAGVVTDRRAVSLAVRMGRIVGIEPLGAAPPSRLVATLDADDVLIPGLVDTPRAHQRAGRTEWEGFDSATAAAGVTRVSPPSQTVTPWPPPG